MLFVISVVTENYTWGRNNFLCYSPESFGNTQPGHDHT
jgi:hypothetical protein